MNWLTAQEIARAGLPGLPATDRGVRMWAKKNCTTRKKLSGKGYEIALSSLPPAARADYYARFGGAGDASASALSVREALPAAPAAAVVETADARLIGRLEDLDLTGASVRAGAGDAARLEKARETMQRLRPLMDLPPRHRGRRAMAEDVARALGVSFQRVYQLEKIAREQGISGLARLGVRRDRGTARVVVSKDFEAWARGCALTLTPAAQGAAEDAVRELAARMRGFVRAAWVGGAVSARQAWLQALAAFARALYDEGVDRAHLAALLRLKCPRGFVEAEGQQYRVAARALRDAKGVYDHHLAPVARTAAGLLPGALVCGDISPLDIPVARPDGSTAYARMIAWHDVATNWLWIDLFLCEKGQGVRREHVAASFARMCECAPFGAPQRLYLDNGSEYKWQELIVAWQQLAALTGQRFRADEAALLPESGRLVRSIPFHPRGKRIEGQFGNLGRWLAWWMGYVGGNRMAKKITNLGAAPAVSRFEDVRAWLAATLADYHATAQNAEHMNGRSPQEAVDAALNAGWKPVRIDRVALMLAFAERQTRRITRGGIHWRGRVWTADFLMARDGEVQIAAPYIQASGDGGGEVLFVFSTRGELLGTAAPQNVFAILDQDGAKEAARRRQALRVLTGERAAEVGALNQAEIAGFRAEVLGVADTVARAQAAAETVELSGELAEMAAAHARARVALSEQAKALMARAKAQQEADSLTRLALEDEDTKAARALGF